MIVIKLILEGLGLGGLLCILCAVGIHGGAIGMIHLYDTASGTIGMMIFAAVLSLIMCLFY